MFWDRKKDTQRDLSVDEALYKRISMLESTVSDISVRVSEINGILARMNARITTAQRESGSDEVKSLKDDIRYWKGVVKDLAGGEVQELATKEVEEE